MMLLRYQNHVNITNKIIYPERQVRKLIFGRIQEIVLEKFIKIEIGVRKSYKRKKLFLETGKESFKQLIIA